MNPKAGKVFYLTFTSFFVIVLNFKLCFQWISAGTDDEEQLHQESAARGLPYPAVSAGSWHQHR